MRGTSWRILAILGRSAPTAVRRAVRQAIIDGFHRLWFGSPHTWSSNRFLGYSIRQCPLDLWLYQELLHRERPCHVIQTGVAAGGSVLYFAHLLDMVGAAPHQLVIGIDIALTPEARSLTHPRIRLIEGSSTAPATVARVARLCAGAPCLVVLDSEHTRGHVLQELELYERFVQPGGHLVVEDTNLNGHPVREDFGPGPREAVEQFLQRHRDFVRDDALWERNLFSFHAGGWLRRTA